MNNKETINGEVTLTSLLKNRNFILILLSSTFTGFAFSIFLLAETLGSFEFVFGTVVVLLLVGAICILPLLGFETEKKRTKTTIFRELRDSFQYALKSQFLIGAMTISIITNLIITGPGTMASPIIVSDILEGSAFDLSLLEASFAIGMVLGALNVATWNPKKRRGIISVTRLILLGMTLLLLSQSTTLWQAIVVLALIGIAISIGDIPIRTLIQEKTDPQMLGRVTGMLGTASRGLAPISYMITAWLLSISISIGTILLVSGIVLICTACISFWKLRGFVLAD